jgi:flagellar biosynthetic protein FlhB
VSASEERTEEATPRRRAKSHAQGISASSALASSALALGAAATIADAALRHSTGWLNAFRTAVSEAPAVAHHPDASTLLLIASAISNEGGFWQIIAHCWVVTVIAAIAAAHACGSLGFAPAAVVPASARITTRMGLRRLVNADSFIQTAGAFAAVVLVATLLTPILFHSITMLAQMSDIVAQTAGAAHAGAVLWWRALIAVALVAVIDVIVQRRKHAVRIKMSPRELREERAQTEGRPEARQRRRAAGLRRLRGLRIDAIRRATAVIANPTHVVVALRYAPPQIDVPVVIARAAGLMAPIVRGVAVAAGVPIVESPELARMLYANVDVDEQIPEEYYAAVAAIFTWIIRTHGGLRRGDEDGM